MRKTQYIWVMTKSTLDRKIEDNTVITEVKRYWRTEDRKYEYTEFS